MSLEWPATADALDALLEVAGDRPLTIWYLPGLAEWDDGVWAAAREEVAYTEADRRAVHDEVADWAADHGVPLIDLTPAIAGSTMDELCFPVDRHWTPRGHARLAEALVEFDGTCHALRMLANGAH